MSSTRIRSDSMFSVDGPDVVNDDVMAEEVVLAIQGDDVQMQRRTRKSVKWLFARSDPRGGAAVDSRPRPARFLDETVPTETSDRSIGRGLKKRAPAPLAAQPRPPDGPSEGARAAAPTAQPRRDGRDGPTRTVRGETGATRTIRRQHRGDEKTGA